jgi:hypothetical protein
MKLNGNFLKEKILDLESKRDVQKNKLFVYLKNKNNAKITLNEFQNLIDEISKLEAEICTYQTIQNEYNSLVDCLFEGKTISLTETIKLIGAAKREVDTYKSMLFFIKNTPLNKEPIQKGHELAKNKLETLTSLIKESNKQDVEDSEFGFNLESND